MLDPILAEDSTITKVVPSLERIVKDLKEDSTHHDYLVALLIVFLAESGFYVPPTDNCSSQCAKHSSIRIPEHWKSQTTEVYDIRFRLAACPDVECKLIAIPSGDTLIVNLFPLSEKYTYSIALRCLMYVNPFSSDLTGRYINLKELSHRFKNTVVTPMRSDILTKAGLMCPSLEGLPTELKLKILNMLDKRTLSRMAQCSSEFQELCSYPWLSGNLEPSRTNGGNVKVRSAPASLRPHFQYTCQKEPGFRFNELRSFGTKPWNTKLSFP